MSDLKNESKKISYLYHRAYCIVKKNSIYSAPSCIMTNNVQYFYASD